MHQGSYPVIPLSRFPLTYDIVPVSFHPERNQQLYIAKKFIQFENKCKLSTPKWLIKQTIVTYVWYRNDTSFDCEQMHVHSMLILGRTMKRKTASCIRFFFDRSKVCVWIMRIRTFNISTSSFVGVQRTIHRYIGNVSSGYGIPVVVKTEQFFQFKIHSQYSRYLLCHGMTSSIKPCRYELS